MSPLAWSRHRDKVAGMIAQGRSGGGAILAGGTPLDSTGFCVKPTLIANAHNQPLTVAREEVFGPVPIAMPYDDIDEALVAARASEYGLGASVWTHQLDRAMRLVDGIEAGAVWVNTHHLEAAILLSLPK